MTRTDACPTPAGPAPYALTFPQLIAQAAKIGLGDEDVLRLRRGYDLAERLADGFYRSQGCALINHLVRVGSIAMAHGGGVSHGLAGMFHPSYMLHAFAGSRRLKARPSDRKHLIDALGPGVEAIVWEYARTPWHKPAVIRRHLDDLASCSPVVRSVLFLRVANELEDHLDLAALYRCRYPYRQRIESFGGMCVEIAERLGGAALGQELRAAYETTLSHTLPGVLVREQGDTYELPRKHFGEKNAVHHLAYSAARTIVRRGRVLKADLLGGKQPA